MSADHLEKLTIDYKKWLPGEFCVEHADVSWGFWSMALLLALLLGLFMRSTPFTSYLLKTTGNFAKNTM